MAISEKQANPNKKIQAPEEALSDCGAQSMRKGLHVTVETEGKKGILEFRAVGNFQPKTHGNVS